MKIIMLDIDGVLNSTQGEIMHHRRNCENHFSLCPIACSNLQWILDQVPDVAIVISSTWRIYHSPKELRLILKMNQISGERIIDTTTNEPGIRGQQIQAWLDKNPVDQFVIFDDDLDMGHLLPRLVRTNPKHGLMLEDAEKAVRMLRAQK